MPVVSRGSWRALLVMSALLTAVLTPAPFLGAEPGAPLPRCRYDDVRTRYRTPGDWRITLLDTIYRLPGSYRPPGLVSTRRAGLNGGHRIRRVIIADLRAMARAARRAHAAVAVTSAYRSYASQRSLFRAEVARYGRRHARLQVARPGHSEHQLGTTIDFRSANSTRSPYRYADWAKTKPGRWLKRHAWEFGFLMSYPKGKTGSTCYYYEPWHYRYVGRPLARDVHESGLTLRRYLWRTYETAPR